MCEGSLILKSHYGTTGLWAEATVDLPKSTYYPGGCLRKSNLPVHLGAQGDKATLAPRARAESAGVDLDWQPCVYTPPPLATKSSSRPPDRADAGNPRNSGRP